MYPLPEISGHRPIFSVYHLRLRYHQSRWQTLGAWYKASALGLYIRRVSPPIILKLPYMMRPTGCMALKANLKLLPPIILC